MRVFCKEKKKKKKRYFCKQQRVGLDNPYTRNPLYVRAKISGLIDYNKPDQGESRNNQFVESSHHDGQGGWRQSRRFRPRPQDENFFTEFRRLDVFDKFV